MIILVLLNKYLAVKITQVSKKTMKQKDERVKVFIAVGITKCLNRICKKRYVRDRHQMSLLMLSELNNFYFPKNHQQLYGFLLISGGIKVNQWAKIRPIIEVNFDGDL